jgi:hypothetical protein
MEKKIWPGIYFVKGGKNKPRCKKRRKAHLKRFVKRRRAKYNVKNNIGNG